MLRTSIGAHPPPSLSEFHGKWLESLRLYSEAAHDFAQVLAVAATELMDQATVLAGQARQLREELSRERGEHRIIHRDRGAKHPLVPISAGR